MARKNIFELLSDFDLSEELRNLDHLIHSSVIQIETEFIKSAKGTIEGFVSQKIYLWNGRQTAISCTDVRYRLNIDILLDYPEISLDDGVMYLEYALNIISQFEKHFKHKLKNEQDLYLVYKNCIKIIERLGFMSIYDENIDTYLLVLSDPSIIAVAEILPEETAKQVMRYHHHLLQGDLEQKRAILLAMGDKYEPLKKSLKLAGANRA